METIISFGQELFLEDVLKITDELDLNLIQRNTLYHSMPHRIKNFIELQSIPLLPINNDYHKPKKIINSL